MGPVSIKLYDKFGVILRIETTVNDLTFFKHYREVEHARAHAKPNGPLCRKPFTVCPPCANCSKAPIGVIWSSFRRLRISAPAETDSTNSRSRSNRKAAATPGSTCSIRKMKPCSIVRGEFTISGLQNKTLRLHLPGLSSSQVSRLLRRLRTHGLVKKVGHTYNVTAFGKEVVATVLKLREHVIIPQLTLGIAL
jgi:hypothetical protein